MNRIRRQSLCGRSSGFTLLEMTISLGLIGLVVSLGAMVADSSSGAFATASSSAQLEAKVTTALNRVAVELEMASSDSLQPQLTGLVTDTDQISMQQVAGLVEGEVVLGEVLTIAYRQDPADPADGVDNDGDGVVDEGRLVIIRDDGGPNEQTVTICRNVRRFLEGEEPGGGDNNGNGLVDESGLLIQRDGDLITVQLTLVDSWANGQITTRTSTTSVRLRN